MSNLVHVELHNIYWLNCQRCHCWVRECAFFPFDGSCQAAVPKGYALNARHSNVGARASFSPCRHAQGICSMPHQSLPLSSEPPLHVLRLCMDSVLQTFASIMFPHRPHSLLPPELSHAAPSAWQDPIHPASPYSDAVSAVVLP